MTITITSHTTIVEPELVTDQYGHDDTYWRVAEQRTDRHVIESADLIEAVEFGSTVAEYVARVLNQGADGSDLYAVFASDYPTVSARTRYSSEMYEDPATGHRTEVTIHLSGDEWTDRLARDVADHAKWTA